MKKVILNMALLSSILCGCSNELLEEKVLQQEDKKQGTMGLRSGGDNTYDLLGFGYDGKGGYCDSDFGKSKVLNVELLRQSYPGLFDINETARGKGLLLTGENAEKIRNECGN